MATDGNQAQDTMLRGVIHNLQQNNFLDDPYCPNEQVIDNQYEYYNQDYLDPSSLSMDGKLKEESYRKVQKENYQHSISASQF
ncbi:unnamed protein product (macronuclear) [Paramecium tetraurelia]|uniref:Uncharacterized protein n=1 Tax=Paramecium tetraurelia TaxID=5888 RepID=A0CGI7_PARTE|nr:uncharacterized protein GSPATT00007344001 [Paramecium tetraurelia]CAK69904.1 unnamed protein product [Paramecium tetraurelia]|eukprot:XP_001437301.1 hypothetical protein (macronuclear) [Paramecium tetraurelia strain d4-2]